MLPTFDFVNVLRKTLHAVGGVFLNPVAPLVALAGVVSSAVALIVANVDAFSINIDIPTKFNFDSHPFLDFILYLSAADVIVKIFNSFVSFVILLVPILASGSITFFGGLWLFRSWDSIRNYFKTLLG